MKKTWLGVLLLAVTCASTFAKTDDPVVMTINGTPVVKSEFEYFYNKNNQQDLAEEKSFDEYVQMFVNYKLKVAEALSRGIDTTQSYREELAGYRAQLAQPYLENPAWADSMVEESIARQKEQIDASHILLMLDEHASGAQVKEKEEQILAYKVAVEAGADFDSLAFVVSEDPSARQNRGRLGYFTSGQMVYSFETAAYNTPVGELAVCRSRFGWHLIKVNDRRPDQGEVLLAHIMKTAPRQTGEAARNVAKREIDSIYAALQGGADFAALAQQHSDDQYTAPRGGEYPWLNAAARFPQEWLGAAFAIGKVGDYTVPFETDFGWHILRLLDKRAEAVVTDEQKAQMREQLSRDPERVAAGRKAFLEKLSKEYGVEINQKTRALIEQLVADTTVTREDFAKKLAKKSVMKIGKLQVKGDELAKDINKKYINIHKMPLQDFLNQWYDDRLMAYEDANLENKYLEFRNLYKEYHDGILLFEVSSGEVWDRASADSAGLAAFFEKNRARYAWDEPRFKGAFVECEDNERLVQALKEIYASVDNDAIKASEIIKSTILTDTTLTRDKKPPFHIINGVFQKGDNGAVDQYRFGIKAKFTPKENFPVVMTFGKILPDGPEEVSDIRGQVIADYQAELEARWVEQLRTKHKVVINDKVLMKIKNEQK